MKCADVINATGWTCYPNGQNSVRAIAPFSIDDDGQLVSFYIAQVEEDKFYLTDAGETAMYIEHLGIRLNKKRIESLNKTYSAKAATFDEDGCIVAQGKMKDLDESLWDAVKLTLSLSFKKEKWQRKFNQEKFSSIVYKELSAQLGAEKIIRKAKIKAASGNTIEFPIGVKREDGNTSYVNPLALEGDRFLWSHVYQLHGKFSDVKAISDINNRFVILEQGGEKLETGRVINFLSDSALVCTLNSSIDFVSIFFNSL
jgi:hypothetical protein